MQTPDGDPYGGDGLLQEVVERAMAPHLGRLSPEQLGAIRDYLIVFVTTHPAAEPLYARLRKRPPVERSTWVEHLRRRDAAETTGAPEPAPRRARRS